MMARGMRRLAGWLAAVAVSTAIVQSQGQPSADPPMPALPASGATPEALVPQGWTIEQRRQPDFNGDGLNDVLLLIRERASQDPAPPRIVLVALATTKPPGFAVTAANPRLVPRDASGNLEDPMADGEITLRSRGFDLKIGMMSGVGSYLAATMRYRFRVEGQCVRLIGFDRYETNRANLDTRDVSVNLLTGDVITTTGNAETTRRQAKRSRLPSNPRRCLQDLPSGWTFDPLAIR